jgi:plastocyanin
MKHRVGAIAPLLIVAVTAVGAAACGSSSSSSSSSTKTTSATTAVPAAPPSAAPGTITIKNFAFTPATIQTKAGQAVTVQNADGTTHTFTADDKSTGVDSGRIDGGKSATVTFAKPGTYTYHCDIHNYMTGTITVS